MRVLFSCSPGEGHFLPLLPLACAFRARGDDVAVAAAASYASRIEAVGLSPLSAGLETGELDARYGPYAARLRSMPIPQRRAFAYVHRFALLDAPARLDELRQVAVGWQPDLLIHEAAEMAAPAVASSLGLPSVHHSFGRAVPTAAIAEAAPVAARMWEQLDLEPEQFGGMFRGSYVDVSPPSLRSDRPPTGTTVLPLRLVEGAVRVSTGRPLIYVTLGTMLKGIAVFRTLLSALAQLDVDVLMTTGRQNDPAEVGPLPSNATVERYVPQAEVLPRCSLVVSHGGSGSTLGALAHGVPMLILPSFADQFDNATAVENVGAARVLLPGQVNEEAVRESVVALLDDRRYRDAAGVIAEEIAGLPAPDEVAETISRTILQTPTP